MLRITPVSVHSVSVGMGGVVAWQRLPLTPVVLVRAYSMLRYMGTRVNDEICVLFTATKRSVSSDVLDSSAY